MRYRRSIHVSRRYGEVYIGFYVRRGLVYWHMIRICSLDRGRHGRRYGGVLGLLRLHRRRSLIVADGADWNGRVVIASAHLERVDAGCGAVLLVAHSGRHTVQLQSGAGGTGPRVRRGRVAFDLSTSTAFARSHHYSLKWSASASQVLYADTEGTHPSSACDGCVHRRRHNLVRLASSLEHCRTGLLFC